MIGRSKKSANVMVTYLGDRRGCGGCDTQIGPGIIGRITARLQRQHLAPRTRAGNHGGKYGH